MWVRGAAIRPVPPYAVLEGGVLALIERELSADASAARDEVEEAFSRFEETQPHLADRVSTVLTGPLDETALALGYFLSIAIWLAFERTFKGRLELVTEDALHATEAALSLEEELRATHADEPIDLDDVIAAEQPGVLAFVHEHLEAALDATARYEGGEPLRDVDLEDVHLVYRAILVLTLALSQAVRPGGGLPRHELMA